MRPSRGHAFVTTPPCAIAAPPLHCDPYEPEVRRQQAVERLIGISGSHCRTAMKTWIRRAARTVAKDARHGSTRAGGFTLIELMVAVAVVAILAAISYPSYADHVLRARLV